MLATLVALGVGQSVYAADEVMVQRPVPFNEGADITGAVKRECKLDEQLPDFIAEYGKERGIEIDFAPRSRRVMRAACSCWKSPMWSPTAMLSWGTTNRYR
jgi:hypothetical protein